MRSDPTQVDGDHDDLTDLEEIELELNAFDSDEDIEGLGDGAEQAWGTDPLRQDTDSDSYSDFYEVQRIADGYHPREHNLKIEKTDWLQQFSIGLLCGDNHVCHRDTIPWILGNLASGFLVFGDVRDFVASAIEGRWMNAAFLGSPQFPSTAMA